MTGYSEKDFHDDYGRRVKRLMEEVIIEIGKPVQWEMLPQYAETPHPTFVITRPDGKKKEFTIAREEEALGTTDDQIREKLRRHVEFALRPTK